MEVLGLVESIPGLRGELQDEFADVHSHARLIDESTGAALALIVAGAHDFFHRNLPDQEVGEARFVKRLLEADGAFAGVITINLDGWADTEEIKRIALIKRATNKSGP